MEDTIQQNMSESEYRSSEGISQSELKEFGNAATPLHFKSQKPREATKDMEFGTVCHTAILQPELLSTSFYQRPSGYVAEVKGKKVMKDWHGSSEWCKEWIKDHSDKPVLTLEEKVRVEKIAARIKSMPEISGALKSGQKEVAFFKRDTDTGLMMKCRVDLISVDVNNETWIFDFKKVQSGEASEREFQKSCVNYGYFIQASYYLHVTGASRFVFVPFDDSEPFDACLYEPDSDALAAGYRRWRKLLDDYAKCFKEDLWPGYNSGINKLRAPEWMKE